MQFDTDGPQLSCWFVNPFQTPIFLNAQFFFRNLHPLHVKEDVAVRDCELRTSQSIYFLFRKHYGAGDIVAIPGFDRYGPDRRAANCCCVCRVWSSRFLQLEHQTVPNPSACCGHLNK